tara:strand:- start:228 stop:491 length:264 start_codon:yes stop_codon:yes gene_type:complete
MRERSPAAIRAAVQFIEVARKEVVMAAIALSEPGRAINRYTFILDDLAHSFTGHADAITDRLKGQRRVGSVLGSDTFAGGHVFLSEK